MSSIMAEWFGLEQQRTDFQIETFDDREFFFARSDLQSDLSKKLNAAFRAGRPPRMVLFGDWGVGKTHTMRHIQYVIDNNPDYNGKVVFVELPDITSKSTFQVAQSALLDALGMKDVQSLVHSYQAKHGTEAIAKIKAITQSEDIANAFVMLIGVGNNGRLCWDWLRGIKLSASDAAAVGLSPVMDQSTQMYAVLRMLGVLSREIDDQILVFMLDECTKIGMVSNPDAMGHWKNTFKLLSQADNKDVGIIVSVSESDEDAFPEALSDEQVRSRFGRPNFIRLNRFITDETKQFLSTLFKKTICTKKRATLMKDYKAQADGEEVSEDTFPFTKPAFDEFATACEQFDQATPRDTLILLDAVLNSAIDENLHIVNSSIIESLLPTEQ